MADVNLKERVRFKIKDKSYDLKPSENPHKDLPKEVVKYLEEGRYLAGEAAPVAKAAGAAELAALQGEVTRLTEANQALTDEKATLAEEVAQLKEAKQALEAEVAELKKPGK